ncbi:hypothetical protein [Deinococcus hohokamensis]|uniref:Uncharacterized protein n=1 Tax=Deinococcus hohokamensis TaxID=309883 RepID=A0ABV9I302_9DEIO
MELGWFMVEQRAGDPKRDQIKCIFPTGQERDQTYPFKETKNSQPVLS